MIFYIKNSLPYEFVDYRHVKGSEIHTIRIRLDKKKWITLTNFYCPPASSSGQEIVFDTSVILYLPPASYAATSTPIIMPGMISLRITEELRL